MRALLWAGNALRQGLAASRVHPLCSGLGLIFRKIQDPILLDELITVIEPKALQRP
jgi:hypothetical protein